MTGRWKKLGQLYDAPPLHPKLVSHAANPLAVFLQGDNYRIYFSGRDAENRSSVGYADIDMGAHAVTYVHPEPVFQHGPEGSFYSHGVSIGNCYEAGGRRYMLFMGWHTPPGEHWRGEIGRLLLENGRLVLDPQAPLMGINAEDKVSLSYPWVLNVNGRYRMWYGSTLRWDAGNGEILHVLNAAESADGHGWVRKGLAVPYALGVAQAFSRPTVAVDEDGWHMWFSYRSGMPGAAYRIGYAQSVDGNTWVLRLAESGIDVSAKGWDSEMIGYPFVFTHKGQRYMLYNGNGFGRTGFGLAVWER